MMQATAENLSSRAAVPACPTVASAPYAAPEADIEMGRLPRNNAVVAPAPGSSPTPPAEVDPILCNPRATWSVVSSTILGAAVGGIIWAIYVKAVHNKIATCTDTQSTEQLDDDILNDTFAPDACPTLSSGPIVAAMVCCTCGFALLSIAYFAWQKRLRLTQRQIDAQDPLCPDSCFPSTSGGGSGGGLSAVALANQQSYADSQMRMENQYVIDQNNQAYWTSVGY